MSVAVISGSAGLIGAECVREFTERGMEVVGIDNDMRSTFFGDEASTNWVRRRLEADHPSYRHCEHDVRDSSAISDLFARYGASIEVVVHCAAQPSHDWAAREPHTDFTVNANGTLNILEATRHRLWREGPKGAATLTAHVVAQAPGVLKA